MGFDVADRFRLDACRLLRHGDDVCLALDAGSGVADLVAAIVVRSEAADDGVDMVAIGDRVLKTLEQHDADA